MEKAAIFIDGGYLNRVLKDSFGGKRVDYLKLSEEICKKLNVTRLRTYYYYCLPITRKGNQKDEQRKSEAQRFLDKLRKLPRFEVKLGKLQQIENQFKQKMVDVLMSLDIVYMTFNEHIQHAILIAGDSDFVPAIQKAKDHGAIVQLFYHPKSVHTHLLNTVDESHIFTEEMIEKIKIEQ